jgi:hypothetical protein
MQDDTAGRAAIEAVSLSGCNAETEMLKVSIKEPSSDVYRSDCVPEVLVCHLVQAV